MSRTAETNTADFSGLNFVQRSIYMSELAGQAISGTSG